MFPTGNYLFKVTNRNTRPRCKICSKLTIDTRTMSITAVSCLMSSDIILMSLLIFTVTLLLTNKMNQHLRAVSSTLLVVWFVSQKESSCETTKCFAISLQKLFSSSRKSKFRLLDIQISSRHHLVVKAMGSRGPVFKTTGWLQGLESVFHPSKVNQMSTSNFWELSSKK